MTVWTSNGPFGVEIISLAVDPASPATVYAGTQANGLFKTTDGGQTWAVLFSEVGRVPVYSIAIDPIVPSTIYLATSNGVYKTTDDGLTWFGVNSGLPSYKTICLAIDPISPSTLYIGIEGRGLYKTTNGGISWELSGFWYDQYDPPVGEDIVEIDIAPSNPSTVYIRAVGVGPPYRIFKSVDAGMSWWHIYGDYALNHSPLALGIDSYDDSTVYAGFWWPHADTDCGVKKTIDGGQTWNCAGIDEPVYALLVNPVFPSIIYIGTQSGMFRSVNQGHSWIAESDGFTRQVRAIAVAPAEPSTVYAIAYDCEGVWSITYANHSRPLSPP